MAIRRVWVGTIGPFLYDDEEHDYAIRTDGELPGGATELGELTDIVLTNLQPGQGLVFNGTAWVNQYISVLIVAPENFDVVVSETTAECSWSSVPGVEGYNVYLKSNGEFVKQNSELITETTYDIENLENGDYEAYATAVIGEVESDPSNSDIFQVVLDSHAFYTDFSEYSLEEDVTQREDWVQECGTQPYEIRDTSSIGGIGGKSLVGVSGSSNQSNQIHYTGFEIDYENNIVDLRVRVRTTSTSGLRIFCGNRAPQAYNMQILETTVREQFTRDSCGTTNSTTDSFAVDANEWYYIRCRRDGHFTYLRIWKDGDDEPGAWNFTRNHENVGIDSNFSGNYFNLGFFIGSSTLHYFDEVVVDYV